MGAIAPSPPNILEDQETLSQPEGNYAHHITTPPPDYQAFLRPYLEYEGKLGGEEFGVPQKTT